MTEQHSTQRKYAAPRSSPLQLQQLVVSSFCKEHDGTFALRPLLPSAPPSARDLRDRDL